MLNEENNRKNSHRNQVADFNADGQPEIVVVSGGVIRIFDRFGNTFSTVPATVPGTGGPPTVAEP